jgi:hypothetical protein
MTLAELVATGMLTLLLGFVAMVVWATLRQLNSEAREVARRRDSN